MFSRRCLPFVLKKMLASRASIEKISCVYLLCRDATKRYNDDSNRQDPSRRLFQSSTPGPGPGPVRANGGRRTAEKAKKATEIPTENEDAGRGTGVGSAIDPALSVPEPHAIPAYFRLSPQSKLVGTHPRMWLGKLTPGATFEALRRAATSKAGAARMVKVSGIVKNDDASEDSWVIENDDELAVYLDEAGEKATFIVLLEGGYA